MNEIRFSSEGVGTMLIKPGEPRLRRHRELRLRDVAVRVVKVLKHRVPRAVLAR